MIYLEKFFLFIYIIIAIFDYSEYVYFLQLKEYRWDRFKDFLNTESGKKFATSYSIFFRPILVITVFLLYYYFLIKINNLNLNSSSSVSVYSKLIFSYINFYLYYCLYFIIIFDLFRIIRRILKRKIYRPVATFKSIVFIFFCIFIDLLVVVFGGVSFLLLLLILRLYVAIALNILFSVITLFIKKIIIKKAKRKILNYQNLVVIGITGSYAKSSVKKIVSNIILSKYKILSTPKNINTDIGIAKFILKSDFNDIDFFIVEMGAYRMGEIKIICDIVKPKIGILTAINEQHISLFGNIRNTQTAKYELLKSLPEDGLAITNSDNDYNTEFLDSLKCKSFTYGTKRNKKPNFLISNIVNEVNLQFKIINTEKSLEYLIKAPVIGKYNAENISAGFIVGDYLGIDSNTIFNQIKTMKSISAMKVYKKDNSVILNDSYNSNPSGFKKALEILDGYPNDYKKVVITRGMLELGEESDKLHRDVARIISGIAKLLIIISPDNDKSMRKGINSEECQVISVYDQKKLLSKFISLTKAKSIILVENRISRDVIKYIKNNEIF